MTGKNAARRVLCCRYRRGADMARDSDDAGATARLGGRQEYRHFSALAQPWVRLFPAGSTLRTSCRASTFRAMATGSPQYPVPDRPFPLPARDELATHVDA